MYYNIEQALKYIEYVIGVHPYKNRWPSIAYCLHAIVSGGACYVLIAWLIFKTNPNLMDITKTIKATCFYLHGICSLTNLYFKRVALIKLINSMYRRFWLPPEIEKERIARNLKLKSFSYTVVLFLDLLYFYFAETLKTGELNVDTFPVSLYIPNAVPPFIMFNYIYWTCAVIIIFIITIDILIFTILALTELQYKLLQAEFRLIFDGVDSANTKVRLERCINHLTFLLEFRDATNDTFSMYLLLYMANNILSLCTNLYAGSVEQSMDDVIRTSVYFSGLIMRFFICYCIPAQRMVDAAEDTPSALYLTNWQNNPKYYKDIVILLGKTQQRVHFSIGGLTDMDHRCGLSTIQKVISYWGFLKTVGAPGP